MGLALAWRGDFLIWPAIYWVINIAYSIKLKHVVVLDAMCIAIGFLLRVYSGGAGDRRARVVVAHAVHVLRGAAARLRQTSP
jgi:4-hydroxybenzoate polyprenyltransferase